MQRNLHIDPTGYRVEAGKPYSKCHVQTIKKKKKKKCHVQEHRVNYVQVPP